MTKHLPDGASLEHLKKQAKALMKSVKDGNQSALQRIAPYFSDISIVGLRNAQLVIAREYGFDSWEKLRAAIPATQENKTPRRNIEPIREYKVKRLLSHLSIGSMLVYIGGYESKIAVRIPDGLVYIDSVDVAGEDFDESILAYVREKGLLIGYRTAERIKIEIGSAFVESDIRKIEVRARNIAEGNTEDFTLNNNQFVKAIEKPLRKIINTVKRALEQTPDELIPGIKEHGLVLSGGGSLLHGFETLLANETGLPAQHRG